ncbi:hypothetical protein CSA17_06095 [bacterium DOLJORAL78_65_58]|nr:MAG: hypothetical protein CSB20_13505 [bacterium DOLZORAL124_64_63]PIE75705.1 MAG: hypothetical protein CSA17_06095 [bacterium DOLJORAL78_65_58]
MVLRKIMGLFVCVLVIGSAAFATAGIPDPTETTATMPNVDTSDDLALFNLPNGQGRPFNDAQIKNDGTSVDAHIEMIVRDAFGAPVANFPREDMWLVSADGGLVSCSGGTTADLNTDSEGFTQWVSPLSAGGYSTDVCVVYVNGLALTGAPFTLFFNSADMNGDGVVNLVDIGRFTAAYIGDYNFSADFSADGVLNLVDIGRLSGAMGATCP